MVKIPASRVKFLGCRSRERLFVLRKKEVSVYVCTVLLGCVEVRACAPLGSIN